MRPLRKRFVSGTGLLWLVAAGHALVGLLLSTQMLQKLHMFTWDIGTFDQVVWNTAHGRWFASSTEVGNYLGDHFSLILALLAPLHYLIPSPYCLLLVQQLAFSLSGALVGLLIFRSAQDWWPAWAGAILIWCHPTAYGNAVRDFHELPLVVPFAIGVYWAALNRYWWWSAVWAGLLLSVREDAGIALAAIGIIFVLTPHGRRVGGIFFMLGCGWVILAQWVWMPMFRAGELADTMARLNTVEAAGGWSAFIQSVLLGARQWNYILMMLLAVLFLPLLAGWRSLALFFSIGHLLLIPSSLRLSLQYSSVPLAITAILLVIVLGEKWSSWNRLPVGRGLWAIRCLALAVVASVFLWRDVRQHLWVLRPEPRVADFAAVQEHLPTQASVAASLTIGSRIAHRQGLYLWPAEEYSNILQSAEPLGQVEYIFTDAHYERQRLQEIESLRRDERWLLVEERGDFALFRHRRD
ncbi:MAG: hypothetical protein HJJLKODD_01356 [Phycisphaerae bacterium]|nr:hypothetical protein [Phycisphaerae bacterium]